MQALNSPCPVAKPSPSTIDSPRATTLLKLKHSWFVHQWFSSVVRSLTKAITSKFALFYVARLTTSECASDCPRHIAYVDWKCALFYDILPVEMTESKTTKKVSLRPILNVWQYGPHKYPYYLGFVENERVCVALQVMCGCFTQSQSFVDCKSAKRLWTHLTPPTFEDEPMLSKDFASDQQAPARKSILLHSNRSYETLSNHLS